MEVKRDLSVCVCVCVCMCMRMCMRMCVGGKGGEQVKMFANS
jgi:hypothetical protein